MPEQDVIIRHATGLDLEAIVERWTEMVDHQAEYDSHYRRASDAHERAADYLQWKIADDKALLLVAEMSGRVVGYLLGWRAVRPPIYAEQDFGFIAELDVQRDYRRQGIGQSLFHAARDHFRNMGIRRLEATVTVRNEASTSFWKKMGFESYIHQMCLHVE